MNTLFYKRFSFKLISQSVFTGNQFFSLNPRTELKVIKNFVIRACSNTAVEEIRTEFAYVRQLLRSNEKYHFALFDYQIEKYPEKYELQDNDLVCELQDWVSASKTASENKYDETLEKFLLERKASLLEKLEKCDTSDLFKVLAFCIKLFEGYGKAIPRGSFVTTYNGLFSQVDSVILPKLVGLKINEALLISDALVLMGKPVQRQCSHRILRALLKHIHRLKDYQVVLTMYLVSQMELMYDFIETYTLQDNVFPTIAQLSLDEVAIVSLGFFDSKTKITHENLRNLILDKLLTETSTAQEGTVLVLCKLIRFGLASYDCPRLGDFQNRITSILPRLSHFGLASIISIGLNNAIYNEYFMTECIEHIKPVFKKLSLKHIEKILSAVTVFNYKDDELINMALEELESRSDEVDWQRHAFVSCIYHLVVRGIFPVHLMKKALTPGFVNYNQKRRMAGVELAWIDAAAQLEVPDYDGPRIPLKYRKKSSKADPNVTELQLKNTKQFSWIVQGQLEELYGKGNIAWNAILPNHFCIFCVVGFDHNMNPISPPQEWSSKMNVDFIYPPDNQNIWVVAQIVGMNHVSRFQENIMGVPLAIARQLKKLGYCVAVIEHRLWTHTAGPNEKLNLVRHCVEKEVRQVIEDQQKQETQASV